MFVYSHAHRPPGFFTIEDAVKTRQTRNAKSNGSKAVCGSSLLNYWCCRIAVPSFGETRSSGRTNNGSERIWRRYSVELRTRQPSHERYKNDIHYTVVPSNRASLHDQGWGPRKKRFGIVATDALSLDSIDFLNAPTPVWSRNKAEQTVNLRNRKLSSVHDSMLRQSPRFLGPRNCIKLFHLLAEQD